jgi:hypothetical protein
MKSFDNSEIANSTFPKEFILHLKNEGFELKPNNSYSLEGLTQDNNVYVKHLGYVGSMLGTVYVCTEGVGVDIDYDCGGNFKTTFYRFEIYGYEQAYDLAVDYVNDNH